MQKLIIRKLSFQSYVLLSFTIGACIGFSIGLIMLVASLAGIDVTFKWGDELTHGLKAGLLNFIIDPLMFSVAGVVAAILSFPAFRLLMLIQKKLTLKADAFVE